MSTKFSFPEYSALPDSSGYFGNYGGRFVAETLVAALEELDSASRREFASAMFQDKLALALKNYVGRPTPLYLAEQLSNHIGGAAIWLKREDLCHTGAHKINNTIGQALIAKRMKKSRVIAETGAGQHGVATAAAAARLGLQCRIYMGAKDIQRQQPNAQRITALGAEIHPVHSGSQTLKDALNEALRDWVANSHNTAYIIGSVAGPHPYPRLVRDLQAVIGNEARQQAQEQIGRLPDALVACVGGGSNAIGLFHAFMNDSQVAMHGVEAAGQGLHSGRHAAPIAEGRPGILHGSRSYLMQDSAGQVQETHSVSAGMDYPAVGPEHAWLRDSGRVHYAAVTDEDALDAFRNLARYEGIIPALESSHALAHAAAIAKQLGAGHIIVNLSGRGDKDLAAVAQDSADAGGQ